MSMYSRSYLNRFYFTKHFVFDKESPDDEVRYPVTLCEIFHDDNSPVINIVTFGKYDFKKTTASKKVSYHELSHTELIESIKRWRLQNPLSNTVDTYFVGKLEK